MNCKKGHTKRAVLAIGLVVALGLLIWVKLRLVTNVPRMAYAQPGVEAQRQAPAKQSAAAEPK
jgi:hypothetical protein